MLKIQQKGTAMKEYYDVISRCSLFAGVHTDELQGLLGCLGGRLITMRRGQQIFREGDPATHVGIVLRGSVQMMREDFYGNRSIVAHIGPAQLFGESYACAGLDAFPISVVADEDGEVLLIDCHRITVTCVNACTFHSRIIYNMLRLVAEKNLVFDQKIQITSQRTTREKLMAYLLSQAKLLRSNSFIIPYDRQELADYLEVDRSGLSAEISKLRREGILKSEKNHFTLMQQN